jgi:hypothetical protein
VIDLADSLMCLVDGVDKGQSDMPCFHLELGQDGVAKGFGGDSSAVGDEKYGSMGHC